MIALIITSVVLFIFAVALVANLYLLKVQMKQLRGEHETQLKELEELFTARRKEYDFYIESFTKYYDSISQIIRLSKKRIQDIDTKGSFQSDDEIGFFFKNIKEIQATLDEYDLSKPLTKQVSSPTENKPSPLGLKGESLPENVVYIDKDEAERFANSK